MSIRAAVRCVAMTVCGLMPAALAADRFPSGEFTMTTQLRKGEAECFEGNQVNGSLNGAALMDSFLNVSG